MVKNNINFDSLSKLHQIAIMQLEKHLKNKKEMSKQDLRDFLKNNFNYSFSSADRIWREIRDKKFFEVYQKGTQLYFKLIEIK